MKLVLTLAVFAGYLSFRPNSAIWTYYSLAPWAMCAFMLILLGIGIKKFGWEFMPTDKVDLCNGAVGLMKGKTAYKHWWDKIYQWVVERVLLL